jgi:hypothetical protein
MADIVQLMIGNVRSPTFMSIPAMTTGGHPGEPPSGFLEVYAGTITLSPNPDGNYNPANGIGDGSPGNGYSFCRVIVPMAIRHGPPGDSDADKMVIRSYGLDDSKPAFWQAAVCVGLAGTSPTGKHLAVESIDRADVILQRQTFLDSDHQVLVLGFQTAFQNTTLLRVAYHITVSGQDVGSSSPVPPTINPPVVFGVRPAPGPTP